MIDGGATIDHCVRDKFFFRPLRRTGPEIFFEMSHANGDMISQPVLQGQDRVYRFLHDKMMGQAILPWASNVLQKVCAPTAPTMQIDSGKTFLVQRAAVMSILNNAMMENSESALALARNVGRSKAQLQARRLGKPTQSPFTDDQMVLAARVRNANFMHVVQQVLKQWELAAMNVLFFNIVAREVAEEEQRSSAATAARGADASASLGAAAGPSRFDGYRSTESGYAKKYSHTQCMALPSVGARVAYKIKHAQLGRSMSWALQMFQEMSGALAAGKVEPRVVYAPIYAQIITQQNDDVPSVLEYFMRMMYVTTTDDIAATHEQRCARLGVNPPTLVDAEATRYYFATAMAVSQSADDTATATESQSAAIVQGTHKRNVATNSTAFSSLFDTIGASKTGSAFGDAATTRESCRCLWLVWLESAERLFTIAHENEHCGATRKTSDALLASKVVEYVTRMMVLLVTLPPPHAVTALFSALLRYIEQHHVTLLQTYGFDLDADGMLARVRRHLCDLTHVVAYCDTVVLQNTPIDFSRRGALQKNCEQK